MVHQVWTKYKVPTLDPISGVGSCGHWAAMVRLTIVWQGVGVWQMILCSGI